MEWKSASAKEGAIVIPKRWIHLHYYEALNILFRTENALRVFVYVILKNELFEKWDNAAIQTAEDQQSTISSTAKKRIAQAKGFGYLGYEINSPLMHLNSGELTRLILSDAYWKCFQRHFKGKKEIIQTKLEEVGTVRNSLAHFRPIKYDDIELIKQNVKHALGGVEECLAELTQTHSVVPTNTPDDWYKALSTLGTDLCGLQLYQSKRDNWVRIEVTYNCPVLQKQQYGEDFVSYRVLNLLSPATIKGYPALARLCTYGVEYIPYPSIENNLDAAIKKSMSLVFAKTALQSEFMAIQEQLKDLLLKIRTESELVQQDNLARGALVESAYVYASLKKTDSGQSWWSFNTSALNCALSEDDPPEYWGDIGLYLSDFIAGSSKYPWMPSEVSDKESPFE